MTSVPLNAAVPLVAAAVCPMGLPQVVPSQAPTAIPRAIEASGATLVKLTVTDPVVETAKVLTADPCCPKLPEKVSVTGVAVVVVVGLVGDAEDPHAVAVRASTIAIVNGGPKRLRMGVMLFLPWRVGALNMANGDATSTDGLDIKIRSTRHVKL